MNKKEGIKAVSPIIDTVVLQSVHSIRPFAAAKRKIILVAGARPNFMKIAPLMTMMTKEPLLNPLLVHTGQHYDKKMSGLFFQQLGIPDPEVNLGVGSGSHAQQTAAIMNGFEPVLLQHRPAAVLVVGDVNSTIACGLVAVKLGITLIHVEAGLRSFDRTMPEEINRVLTDAISDMLFCSEQSGMDNLRREGVSCEKTFLVGNVMIDNLLRHRENARSSNILDELRLSERSYVLVTLHRPANVDDSKTLTGIMGVLEDICHDMPVVFPVHPRTRARLQELQIPVHNSRLMLLDPVGYLEFLKLMSSARLVLTDSGGVQEETTILRVPCLTLRDNTERPVTLDLGSNRLVGTEPDRIRHAYRELLDRAESTTRIPPLWDGRAAERIVAIIRKRLGEAGC